MHTIFTAALLLCALSACSSDSSKKENETTQTEQKVEVDISTSNLPIPDNRFANNYQVLMFGNSHTSGLDTLIQTLIIVGNSAAEIEVINAGGGYLSNSSSQQRRIELLENHSWTHIILQGQKYSQSGAVNYPTAPAKTWISKAKSLAITPILFPEHPQKGNADEGKRLQQLHLEISSKQRACVAPIGLTWDDVIMTDPKIDLHQLDGNHASLIGRLLSAYVFYEVITGNAADLLPYIDTIDVDEPTQQLLKQIASATIQSNPPCNFDE